MFIVLLGAPGAGKGTIARILLEKIGIPQISTGDLFRYNLKNETELGKQAKEYMEKGELVPDEITIKMLEEELMKHIDNGAVFDGFPRTENQAIELDKILARENKKVDMAVNLEVPVEDIVRRISTRITCSSCGAIYNTITMKPKIENVCDKCGATLYQRDDQKPEVIKNRLKVYEKSSRPLIDFYKRNKKLYSIQAGDKTGGTSNDIAEKIIEIIKEIDTKQEV